MASINANDVNLELDRESVNRAIKKLNQLTDIEKDAVVAKGLQEGTKIIAKQTKENIDQRLEEHEGNLIGSVKTLTRKKRGRGYVGFKRPEGAIAHVLSRGTKVRRTKSGANRGRVKGYYFQRDAINTKGQEALNTLAESIEKSIDRIMNL